jgi:hypothetical protein
MEETNIWVYSRVSVGKTHEKSVTVENRELTRM